MEQIPEGLTPDVAERQVDGAHCCVCHQKWTTYRGQFACASKLCGVPVIVCTACVPHATAQPQTLQCDLCQQQYRPPTVQPDLVGLKRIAEAATTQSTTKKEKENIGTTNKKAKLNINNNATSQVVDYHMDCLFLSRLPLTATVTKIRKALCVTETDSSSNIISSNNAQRRGKEMKKSSPQQTSFDKTRIVVQWLTDHSTNAFYGSCIVQMPTTVAASNVIKKANGDGISIDKKRIKVALVRRLDQNDGDKVFPPPNYEFREYPPIQ